MRLFSSALYTLLLLTAPTSLNAQSLEDRIFGAAIRKHAEGALAVFGISAVPSETASTLNYSIGSGTDADEKFRSAQLGGGFRVSKDFPLWLEGYIGYSRYDPVLVFSQGSTQQTLPLKWTSGSVTGGVGWDFDLTENLSLRPVALVSLGRVQTDLSIGANYIADELGLDLSIIKSGGMTVGGLGGSFSIDYNKRWENDYEVDFNLKQTYLWLKPIDDNNDLDVSAEAITTGLWSRLRIPTGYMLFDRPVRTVTEFSASYLAGDQGQILNTTWLARIGAGLEIDFEQTKVPIITTTRLVARYTVGNHLEGFSVGLAASF